MSTTTKKRLSNFELKLECKKEYFDALRDHFLTSRGFTLEEAWDVMPFFGADFPTYPILKSLLEEMASDSVLEAYSNGYKTRYRF